MTAIRLSDYNFHEGRGQTPKQRKKDHKQIHMNINDIITMRFCNAKLQRAKLQRHFKKRLGVPCCIQRRKYLSFNLQTSLSNRFKQHAH